MTRQRSSNRSEICPVCHTILKTRMGAVAHYRAHVRTGELVGGGGTADSGRQPTQFRFPDHPDKPRAWFKRGLSWSALYVGDTGRLLRDMGRFLYRLRFSGKRRVS